MHKKSFVAGVVTTIIVGRWARKVKRSTAVGDIIKTHVKQAVSEVTKEMIDRALWGDKKEQTRPGAPSYIDDIRSR